MGKLHLKETPEERAERKWRKQRRAERKARRKSHLHSRAEDEQEPSRKRSRTTEEDNDDNDDGDDMDGWMPPHCSTKIDADQIRAEVEERMFREKLFDAMQDDYDHRLDELETQFNNYAHVPNRWKSAAAEDRDPFDHPSVNPNEMTDEEYAEWVRAGMWRRTHKAEIEELERKKAERQAQKDKERKANEETARLERQRDTERKFKRELKEKRRLREAWGYYETRWKAQTSGETQGKRLKFQDVPWPVFSVPHTPEDLTSEGISAFLLHDINSNDGAGQRTRKERVREALLRWHPDKFEGKMGSRLDVREKEIVMEGVGIVARCLNEMMAR